MAGYDVGVAVFGLQGLPIPSCAILVSLAWGNSLGPRRRGIILRYALLADEMG
jgi:hypothetical protein